MFLSADNDPRINGIISEIRKEDQDIIALQEIWLNCYVDKIKRSLSDYTFISGSNSFFNKGGLVTGIKGKKIKATNNTFSSTTGSSFVENLGGKGYQTILLPKDIPFINTHLYAATNKAEESITKSQFEFLSAILEKKGGLLAGDLNIEQHDFLKINKLFQYTPTKEFTLSKDNKYANSRLNKTPVSKKIDYCLGTQGFQVTEKILTNENSDHFAITGNILY